MTTPTLTITLPTTITLERLSDLLCCGFEGGVGYWAVITGYLKPAAMPFRTDPAVVFKHLDFPLNPGGAVFVQETESGEDKPPTHCLDFAAVKRGCKVMAEKYPRHWANFLAENDDSETGDVFIQCCLLGEIVYG